MASTSKPMPADAPALLPRAAGTNAALRVVRQTTMTRAGRAADDLGRRLGVAGSYQPDSDLADRIDLPYGVWPRTTDDDTAEADAAVLRTLEPALARYATTLRARREPRQQQPRRGLPVVARRGGATAHGPMRGPGGLARSCAPTDHDAPAIDVVRARRATSDEPPALPVGRTGVTTASGPKPDRSQSVRLRPRRRGSP